MAPQPKTPQPETRLGEPSAPTENAVYGENVSHEPPENIYENIYHIENQPQNEPRLEYVPSVVPVEPENPPARSESSLYPSLI